MGKKEKKILIIGAGPCGLGAAWRLNELGYGRYSVFEEQAYVGGLSASFVDTKGFTWDIGGHIQFSHYDYFDRVMQEVISPDGWIPHERESWIWMKNRFIPYPLQYNIGRLPRKEMMECLEGLIACRKAGVADNSGTFRDWIMKSFGEGIARHFMLPYNRKVWAYPPERLDASWIGERVAVPNIHRVMKNIIEDRDDCAWGPNNTFSFPLHGGTGAIWEAVAERLPQGKVHLNASLVSWDRHRKVARFSNGKEEEYDCMISTIPLDRLLQSESSSTDTPDASFLFSASNIIGVGLCGEPPEKLKTKCWMYFPEDDNPFYRVTVFSNYSHNNVPSGGYWSLMGEISESLEKPVDHNRLIDSAVEGLKNTQLIEDTSRVHSTWTFRAEYAYPTPFIGRNELLDSCLPVLKHSGIYSRGRFGAWKYECSNQDHVFMQGVEAVENILFDTPELTYRYPAFINAHRIR